MKKEQQKQDKIIILVLFAATMLVSLIGVYNGHNWGGDFSQYIAQARAVATNTVTEWYQKNSFTIEHSSVGLASKAYPWLFPLMIVPIWTIWGLNYIPYQVFLGVVFACVVVAFYVLMRKREINRWIAILFSVLLLVNGEYLQLTKSVLSDLPCLLFVLLSWIAMDQYLKNRSVKNAVLTGICCFLAFFARTMGLAVLGSLAVMDAIWFFQEILDNKNRLVLTWKKVGVLVLPYFLFAICWGMVTLLLPRGGSSYTTYFHFSISMVAGNIRYYLGLIKDFFLQKQLGNHHELQLAAKAVICIPVCSLAAFGFFLRLKKKDHLPVYCLILMAMLLVYSYRQGTRFIISLYPAMLIFIFEGGSWLVHRKQWIQRVVAVYGAAACLLCFACSAKVLAKTATATHYSDVSNPQAMETYAFINQELEKDDIVYFEKPRVLYLYTGVYSYITFGESPNLNDADYVLVRKGLGYSQLGKIVDEEPEKYDLIFSNEVFRLYRVSKTNKDGSSHLKSRMRSRVFFKVNECYEGEIETKHRW